MADDPLDEFWIRQTCFAGCEREVFVVGENRVWIRLDEIKFVLRREAQIDARVAVNGEQSVDVFTRVLNIRDKRWIEIFGEFMVKSLTEKVFLVFYKERYGPS